MPTIGVPDSIQRNNEFKQVKLAPSRPKETLEEKDKGRILNKAAGNADPEKSKYVDSKKHNKMGKDEFLKLLSHQLANQDPLNPMDQNKFAADLAQFSQLEQLANMNTGISKLGQGMPTETKFHAASFLGREVYTMGSSLSFKGEGTRASANFSLEDNARNVIVRIFDNRNQMIKQLDMEGMSKGANTVTWDGMSNDGSIAGSGDYRIQVQAWNNKLEPINAETRSSGLVTGVHFNNGDAILTLDNGKKVGLKDVHSFALPGGSGKKSQASSKVINGSLPGTISPNLPPANQQAYQKAMNNGN